MLFKCFSIFSSGGLFVEWSGTVFSNFGRGPLKEHFCETILKSVNWSRMRCYLNFFSIFSFGGQFV